MKKIFLRLFILLTLIFGASSKVFSQTKAVQLDLGTIKTALKDNALNVALNYVKSLDSLFKVQDILQANGNSLFQLTPQFNIQTGTGDAFSSINAKLTGLFMRFKDTTIAGLLTPNTARTFQTFPISTGIETNNKFNNINGIIEAGWVPWYQTTGNRRTPKWLKHTKVGIFIQGGYKFGLDTTGKTNTGGEMDQSKEKIDNAIMRAKGSFSIDTKSLFELSGTGVGIVGNLDSWYDVLNNQIYYSVKGKLRFYLTKNKDTFFDFNYQKGSGAPNFNRGNQYGMGLTLSF